MLDVLQVNDPLATQTVTMLVQLKPGPRRDARVVQLSVGVEGKAPVILTGTFGDFDALVAEAWRQYSLRPPAAPNAPRRLDMQPVTPAAPSAPRPAMIVAEAELEPAVEKAEVELEPVAEGADPAPAPESAAVEGDAPPDKTQSDKASILALF